MARNYRPIRLLFAEEESRIARMPTHCMRQRRDEWGTHWVAAARLLFTFVEHSIVFHLGDRSTVTFEYN